jgi:hypothetical protein
MRPLMLAIPHADATSPARNVLELSVGDAVALIFDLQHEGLGVNHDPDVSRLASRVPMDIGQRLLNDSKEHGLGVERQPLEALGQVQIHLDAAALGKAAGVPP